MTPHPEQNTQQPSDVIHACFVCKELGATVFHGFVSHRTEDWRHVDCISAPAPQTEAGDVEAMALGAAREIAENTDAASITARGPRFIFEEYIHEQQEVIIEHFRPLTKRIAELQAENERLTNKLNTDSQNFQIECQKAEIKLLRDREARVKELEQKLAGALKVTTENTIAHMQAKP